MYNSQPVFDLGADHSTSHDTIGRWLVDWLAMDLLEQEMGDRAGTACFGSFLPD